MEKIYIENNKNGDKKHKNYINLSTISSFILAFTAIALVGTSYFLGNSYALPEVKESLPDNFTTSVPSAKVNGNSPSGAFPIMVYKTTGGELVYCLERDINYTGNTNYSKDGLIEDYGLLYVMANSYPHKTFKDKAGVAYPEEIQVWITQAMIWEYLHDIGAANNTSDTAMTLDLLESIRELDIDDGNIANAIDLDDSVYNLYMKDIINVAKTLKTPQGNLSITAQNDKMTLTNEGKYYQSSLITVTGSPSDNFIGHKISFTGPKDTVLISENGDIITNLDFVTPNTKFYVRVPVESVDENNKVIKLSTTGSFRLYEGYYYKSPGAQTISSVHTVDKQLSQGLEIPINLEIKAPDTKVDTSIIIYIVAGVIFVAGVIIIVRSSKPRK